MKKQELLKRAWQDKDFVAAFRSEIWNKHKGEDAHTLKFSSFDLRGTYERLKSKGWDQVFKPLDADHAVRIIIDQQPS